MSAQPQTVTINGSAAGLAGHRFRTLLSSPVELLTSPGGRLTLPAYGAWVAAVE